MLGFNTGIMAKNKTYLSGKVIEELLGIESAHHEEGRKDLIRHDIIQSFSILFDQMTKKERIISFVDKQLNSSRPKNRKAAKPFLNKFKK